MAGSLAAAIFSENLQLEASHAMQVHKVDFNLRVVNQTSLPSKIGFDLF